MYFLYFLTLVSTVSSLVFHYAIDIYNPAPYNDFVVLKNGGYQIAFISAYVPSANGLLDPSACNSIKNAAQAGIGIEIYMTPNAKGTKSAAQQAKEVVTGLKGCNINVSGVWIQVVQPSYWPKSTTNNLKFVNDLITAYKSYGVTANIYTKRSDWQSIVDAGIITPRPLLWYYSVTAGGVAGESQPNFNDFVPFNGWTSPSVKQFAQNEQFNNVILKPINRDVYVLANGQKMIEQLDVNGRIIVGGNIQEN